MPSSPAALNRAVPLPTDRLHASLSRTFPWYARWHRNPYHGAAHWAALVAFSLALVVAGSHALGVPLFEGIRAEAATVITVQTGSDAVANGNAFSAALAAARCGDTIVLQAGATYKTGASFTLPSKGVCTGTDADYITIRTSDLGGIAASGARIDPARHASHMPRLVNDPGYPVLTAAAGAHHYKLVGLEVTTTGLPRAYGPDLISFGAYFTRQQKLDTHHIYLDRLFVHPAEISATNLLPSTVERSSGRGISAAVSHVWIVDSYVAGFAGRYPAGTSSAGQAIDSYGIYSDTGPGPLHIINNYVEAQFNNIFIGGAGMTTPNTATVSGASLTGATFSNVANLRVGDLVAMQHAACGASGGKPWQTGRVTAIAGSRVSFAIVRATNSCAAAAPDNGGTARWNGDHIHDVEIRRNTLSKPDAWNSFSSPKAWIEVKELVGGVIDGNDMYSGVGTTVAFTVRNQDGASPWSAIEDVSFTNNRMRGYKWGFGLLLADNEQPTVESGSIVIRNNLLDLPRPVPGSADNFVQLVGGHDVTIAHNTVLAGGSPVVADSVTTGLTFSDNVFNNNAYGMQCSLNPNDIRACWPDLQMKGNVVIGPHPVYARPDCDEYPAGNSCATTLADVRITNANAGDFRLLATSPYRNKATDGTDPGVSQDRLESAIGGLYVPPAVTPTPTSTATSSPKKEPDETPAPTPILIPRPTPGPAPKPLPGPAPKATSTPDRTYVLSGRTYEASSPSSPFSYLYVQLLDAQGNNIRTVQEAADGRFSFTVDAGGTYLVRYRDVSDGYWASGPAGYEVRNVSRDVGGLDFGIGHPPYFTPDGSTVVR